MLAFDGVLGLALLGLWLYCIIDVVTTDDSLVRNLPKMVWLLIVLFLPDIGSVIWLVAGRPPSASFRIGGDVGGGVGRPPSTRRPVGIEDRADFGVDLDRLSPIVREREEQAQLRLRQEQLRRREAELARLEQEAELKRREDDLARREKELRDIRLGLDATPPPAPEAPDPPSETEG
ncbi:MAG: hypothetical protein QOI56_1637 [Actinomycetota bacterium]|nr:hypothetical protein [Actinomycetota bacterium]MEA2932852.1 hypothetical protein [Actinomycetota bacterium]